MPPLPSVAAAVLAAVRFQCACSYGIAARRGGRSPQRPLASEDQIALLGADADGDLAVLARPVM